jgi:hypothetical protein
MHTLADARHHVTCCDASQNIAVLSLLQAFAYESDMFSRAQVLRRDGCAPAAMGLPDDLPTRMAYQQLNVLAGMAGKVRSSCRPWRGCHVAQPPMPQQLLQAHA